MRCFQPTSLLACLLLAASPVPAQRLVRLSGAESRQLETYFSNFAEASLGAFKEGQLTDRAMIAFGIAHNHRNNENHFETVKDSFTVRIAARYVDESAQKYFGVKLGRRQSVGKDIRYRDGYYFTSFGEGDIWHFAQVSEFRSLRHGRYSALLAVFSAPNTWSGDVHALQHTWRDDGSGLPQFEDNYLAIVKKVTEQGKNRYILLQYQKWYD